MALTYVSCFYRNRAIGGVKHQARSDELGDEDIGAKVGAVEYNFARLSVCGDTGHHTILVALGVQGQLLEVDEVVVKEV